MGLRSPIIQTKKSAESATSIVARVTIISSLFKNKFNNRKPAGTNCLSTWFGYSYSSIRSISICRTTTRVWCISICRTTTRICLIGVAPYEAPNVRSSGISPKHRLEGNTYVSHARDIQPHGLHKHPAPRFDPGTTLYDIKRQTLRRVHATAVL